jgi:RecA-family ATPase
MRPTKINQDSWDYARKVNAKYIEEREDEDLDIVMVGDSITEKWQGSKVCW